MQFEPDILLEIIKITSDINLKIENFSRIDKIIEDLELELIEFSTPDIEERRKRLPLVKIDEICTLVWNLLTSDEHRKHISYKDYTEILTILIGRSK